MTEVLRDAVCAPVSPVCGVMAREAEDARREHEEDVAWTSRTLQHGETHRGAPEGFGIKQHQPDIY